MRAVALQRQDLRIAAMLSRHWPSLCAAAVVLALLVMAGISFSAGSGTPRVGPAAAKAAVPALPAPPSEPSVLRNVAPTDAVAINAALPVSGLPNPAATPFLLRAASAADRARSLDCLTAAIYYEAATEPLEGQRAVAQVVLNRVRHPAYPNTVCGVVYQGAERTTGCQFTFTCDGSLRRAPMASYWERARQVAEAALSGYVYAPVGWATHYHTNWVVPYWASSLVKAANVGTHIFYRWTGGWGRAPAFSSRHPGFEPAISRSALAARQAQQAEATIEVDAAAEEAAEAAAPILDENGRRAVVRRYEPLARESATSLISERAGSDISASQRWLLTGQQAGSGEASLAGRAQAAPAAEAPSTRPAEPPVLDGVRMRESR